MTNGTLTNPTILKKSCLNLTILEDTISAGSQAVLKEKNQDENARAGGLIAANLIFFYNKTIQINI